MLYLDDAPCLEAARGSVPGQLRALFARLDADMDAGIELGDVRVAMPDVQQRCRFVLGRLLHALESGQPEFAQALLIYLAGRWPELRAVHARRVESGWDTELELA